jgi:DNA-binding protein WhiA
MGGALSARAVDVVRRVKRDKNNANRQTNADMANLRRTTDAAGSQMLLVEKVRSLPEYRSLSPALREFCTLRMQNPELSLAQLGELCDPPASKSAMYHRVLRLQALLAEKEDSQKT